MSDWSDLSRDEIEKRLDEAIACLEIIPTDDEAQIIAIEGQSKAVLDIDRLWEVEMVLDELRK